MVRGGSVEALGLPGRPPALLDLEVLHRMWNETKGRVTRNVTGKAEAEKIAAIFQKLGRMSWESFVRNRLTLLTLPDDLKDAPEAERVLEEHLRAIEELT